MIEMAMFFGLGFFTACLATIFVANAVWRRAVRLTTKRVQAAMPISLAEIKADRDQLRADFAMSTRKLEISVDDLKQKMQGQVTEIAKKNEQIRLLLLEVRAKSETVRELEQREQGQRLELLKSESELGEATRKFRDTEKTLSQAQVAMAERDKTLANSQSLADQRRVEIAAMNTKVTQLQYDLAHLERQREALEADHTAKHEALAKTERSLAEERAVGKSMATKLDALEKTVQAQAHEVGQLQAKLSEVTAQLRAQMAETERAVAKAQSLLGDRNKIDDELARRTAEAEMRLNNLLQDMERTKSERASLEGQLAAAREERNRFAKDMKRLESGASDNWERERSENALMRERINDIASEISHLGTAISGEDESINEAFARNRQQQQPQESWAPAPPQPAGQSPFGRSRNDAVPSIRKAHVQDSAQTPQQPQGNGNSGRWTGNASGGMRPQNFQAPDPPAADANGRKLTLAERMRRLQERTGLPS